MANMVTVKVEGLQALGERMKNLSEDMNKKIARAATAAGGTIIKNAAIQKAPSDTGNLKKNIIIKRIPPAQTGLTAEYIVTVRRKRTKKQKESGLQSAYYGTFVEYGTVKMAAQPFLRPAFDQNKEKAVEAMKDRIAKRLTKAGA